MSHVDKEKARDVLNGAKEKAKVALSEIKANFKADEGTSGARKIQSMFANLWRSGTTGKAALIAGSMAALLMLMWVLGGNGAGEYERTLQEMYRVAGEICELDALLEHEDPLSGMWRGMGLSLEIKHKAEIEKALKEYNDASSDDRKTALLVQKKMLKELKDELQKRKAECAKKGVEIGGSSPLVVAKRFLSLYFAKAFEDAYDECCIEDDQLEQVMGAMEVLMSKDIDDIPVIVDYEWQEKEQREEMKKAKEQLKASLEKKYEIKGIKIDVERAWTEVSLGVSGSEEEKILYLKKVDDEWKVFANSNMPKDFILNP